MGTIYGISKKNSRMVRQTTIDKIFWRNTKTKSRTHFARERIGACMKIEFRNRLRVEHRDTDRNIRLSLIAPLVVAIDDRVIVVPIGFVTDLASVPRAFWWIPGFSPLSRSERSAVLHDWMYSISSQLPYSREQADSILMEGMIADGESTLVARAYWAAVRALAGGHWKSGA